MKRLLICFLFVLNLHIVIDNKCVFHIASSKLMAQHMELEGGNYDCHDDEIGWFKSVIPCDGLIVTPDGNFGECDWCHVEFRSSELMDHMYKCPERERQSQDPWANDAEGNTNAGEGSPYGGGGGSPGGGGHYGGSPSSTGTHNSSTPVIKKPNVASTTPIEDVAAAVAGFAYKKEGMEGETYKQRINKEHIYESETLQNICKQNGFSLDNYESGFKCSILEQRDNRGNVIGYICSFAGTDTDYSSLDGIRQILNDVSNDLWNYVGILSPQYSRAQNLAEFLDNYCTNKGIPLSFVGHSLGGGLATIASIATGRDAITFNAAEVYCERLPLNEWFGIGQTPDTSHVYAYVMDGEFVNITQTSGGTLINIPNTKNEGMFDAHGIFYMYETLLKICK